MKLHVHTYLSTYVRRYDKWELKLRRYLIALVKPQVNYNKSIRKTTSPHSGGMYAIERLPGTITTYKAIQYMREVESSMQVSGLDH